jgi:cytoskeleton protein RodZ
MDTPEQPDTFDQENAANVGELLRSARLKSGEDLKKIATVLRINYAYLEAIEEGRFEVLPGATYSLGFVRAYSEYLGLESSEVIRQLKSQVSIRDSRSELDFPQPLPEASVPGGAVIFIGFIFSLVAYGAWYINSSNDGYFIDLVASLPERFSDSVKPTKPTEEFEYGKQDLTVIELKKEAGINERITANSEKDIVGTTTKLVPNQQVNAEEALNLTERPDLVQQPEAGMSLVVKTKSYPVPQLKSEKSPDSLAGPLTKFVASPSEAFKNVVETALLSPRPKGLENIKEKYSEAILAKNASPTSKLDNSASSLSTTERLPSLKKIALQVGTPVAELLKNTSVVPMDLIPSALPIATEDRRGKEGAAETLSAAMSTSAVENDLSENKLPALTKKEFPRVSVSTDDVRIVIKARTASWIQVRDDTVNEILLTRLLGEGDSYDVPNRIGLMLSAGNAGALDIFVDGKAVPSIGENGDVRRAVLLDAAKLKSGTAVSE